MTSNTRNTPPEIKPLMLCLGLKALWVVCFLWFDSHALFKFSFCNMGVSVNSRFFATGQFDF